MPLMCCPHSPKLILRFCVFHCTPFNWMISHQLLWQMKDNKGCCQYFPQAGLPLQGCYRYNSAGSYKIFILKPLHHGHPQMMEAGKGVRAAQCFLNTRTSSPLEWQISFAFLRSKRRDAGADPWTLTSFRGNIWVTDIKSLFSPET